VQLSRVRSCLHRAGRDVASTLDAAKDAAGNSLFKDVTLISAKVPIVNLCHAATGVEVDISNAHSAEDLRASAVVARAMKRHRQLRPMALVLKVRILMMRACIQRLRSLDACLDPGMLG
jgi:DNA polymerase sigma